MHFNLNKIKNPKAGKSSFLGEDYSGTPSTLKLVVKKNMTAVRRGFSVLMW